MVTELNETTFKDFIGKSGIVIVDCWAPWCGPCRRMGPIIHELDKDMAGKVAVGQLNTDEPQAIAMQYDINAIPTLLIFKDGVAQEPLVGLRPKEDIISYIDRL